MNRIFLTLAMVAGLTAPAAAGWQNSAWNTPQSHHAADMVSTGPQYSMYQTGMRHGDVPIMGGYRTDYYGCNSASCDPWADNSPCCTNLWDNFCGSRRLWCNKSLLKHGCGQGCGDGCGSGCGQCCGGSLAGWRLPAANCCGPKPACGHKHHFGFFKKHGGCKTGCDTCNAGCDTCGDAPCGCKKSHHLLSWIKSLHHHKRCNGCDTCGGSSCDSCGSGMVSSGMIDGGHGEYQPIPQPTEGEVIPSGPAPSDKDALPELELQKSASWLMPSRLRLLPIAF